MLKLVLEEVRDWAFALIGAVPGRFGRVLRGAVARFWLGSCGTGVRFGAGLALDGRREIRIGNNVHFGRNCTLDARGGAILIGDRVMSNDGVILNASVGGRIEVGADSLIGPNVVLRSASHRFDDPGRLIRDQGHVTGDIRIGRDVWLAANVTVLPDVTIGDGAVIAAGAVVSRDIPAYAVAAGVPAKVIRKRGEIGHD